MSKNINVSHVTQYFVLHSNMTKTACCPLLAHGKKLSHLTKSVIDDNCW